MTTYLFPGVQESTDPSTTVTNSAAASLAVPSTPQSISTTSLTYLTGSKLPVPNGGLTLNSQFEFDVGVTKTGAGTATGTVSVLAGPKGDATDTVVATFTKPAGTANAGSAKISVKGRTIGEYATSQVPYMTQAEMVTLNSLGTGGVIALPVSVIPVLTTLTTTQVAALQTASFVGLAVALGASDVYTVDAVDAELSGLSTGNPA